MENPLQQASKKPYFLISVDTTGSMRPATENVRLELRNLAESMFKDIPNLKMGMISHGDYCDGENCIKSLDFTDNIDAIMSFIMLTPLTQGGDSPEAYELALHTANNMSWGEEGGTFVLIGDATPHEVNEPKPSGNYFPVAINNPDNLDWKVELENLKSKKVEIFGMQCLKNNNYVEANNFWNSLAEMSGTPLLILDHFNDSSTTLGAIGYATAGTKGLATYEARLCGMSSNVTENTEKLRNYTTNKETNETT